MVKPMPIYFINELLTEILKNYIKQIVANQIVSQVSNKSAANSGRVLDAETPLLSSETVYVYRASR